MTDIFTNDLTPAIRQTKQNRPYKRRPKRVGQTLKRLWTLIDDPQTPIDQRIELVKMADRLARTK